MKMDKQLSNKLHQLLNEEKFEEARKLIEDSFKTITQSNAQDSLILQTELFGFLADIGCESKNEKDLKDAIIFFETNEEQLLIHLSKSSFYYNLANAKHGLGKIFYTNNKGVQSLHTIKEIFQDPIKLYWLAYKNVNSQDSVLLQSILINLSNSLFTVCRLVEGLQFLDIVLRNSPKFPQALISRGDNLNYLSLVTNCAVTTSLYSQIYRCYDEGLKTNTLPTSIFERSNYYREQAYNTINKHGFNVNDIEKEIQESENEFNNHTPFRKYCITNFLTLNEHSIYCNCVATGKDTLQIGVKHGIFKGEIVPRLELLLNRLKSEFALSRWLFYKSLQTESEVEYDTMFSELLDNEIINSQTEMNRISFRLCYGILDKISLGICKLYNLESKFIHFETFWDEPKRNAELNNIKNIHLNALYSIACDLNSKTGELKHFKSWRNDLEHNLLVLKDTSKKDFDILKLFKDDNFINIVDSVEFKNKTLHLMQLTRAAIFSFVYCVRFETIQQKMEGYEEYSFVIDFKK